MAILIRLALIIAVIFLSETATQASGARVKTPRPKLHSMKEAAGQGSPGWTITDLDPEAAAIPASDTVSGYGPAADSPQGALPAKAAAASGPDPSGPPSERVRPEKGKAVLNFSEAGIKDVLRTIAEITGENFIIAPGVNARISVQTAKPVDRKDVFGIFESILEVNGLSAVKSGSYYKIVPQAGRHSIEVANGKDPDAVPEGDRVMNLVVPIDFISSNDVVQVLKPYLSPAGNISGYAKANTVIITDIASNLKGHLDIIRALDSDAFKRMSVALIPVKHVDAKTLWRELSDILNAVGIGKDASQMAVVPLERLNSLIVLSGSPDLLASAREWIERLDAPASADGAAIHIYYVKNDKASGLSALLERLYGGKKIALTSVTHEAQTHGFQSASQTTAQASTIKIDPMPLSMTRPDSERADDIRIYIYEPANALIIQASQRDYQNILNTLEELDKPPKQVLIDALIAEVKLDESTKYGVQWSALTGNFNIQQNTGILPSILSDPRSAISAPIGAAAPTGLTAFATDASKFFAVVQALASTGRVDVLSNPHVVVKNYEKAMINVGSDEPVATQSTQTPVTGTAGLIQNIEYRKTGVILTVTPQITEGGTVAMTIRQEVSDKSTDRTVGNATYPSFTKREAETSVVARDRETLVIGGLIQEKKDKTTSGIPLLSSIPIIGSLFRFTAKNDGKTELVILLTPTVISNSEEASAVTREMKERLAGLKGLLSGKALKR